MPRFRAIYLDLDGTSLGPSGQPLPETLEALAAYRLCGGRVGIATGRNPQEIRPLIEAMKPVLPLVVYNGAATVSASSGRIIAREPLDQASVTLSVDALGREPSVRQIRVEFASRTVIGATADELRQALSRAQLPNAKEPAIKIVAIVDSTQRDAISARLGTATAGHARAVVSSDITVETLPTGANKRKGIEAGLKSVGLGPGDVLVFGDSPNDKEMLSGLPASMVMGNCHPEVCNVALARIGRNDTDAIARVIRTIAMGPSCEPEDGQ